jgi:hypothetical protein
MYAFKFGLQSCEAVRAGDDWKVRWADGHEQGVPMGAFLNTFEPDDGNARQAVAQARYELEHPQEAETVAIVAPPEEKSDAGTGGDDAMPDGDKATETESGGERAEAPGPSAGRRSSRKTRRG